MRENLGPPSQVFTTALEISLHNDLWCFHARDSTVEYRIPSALCSQQVLV